MSKRTFDFMTALVGFIILSPLFLLVALLIKLDSTGPVFFRQERIGKGFRPFRIYKFRTMVQNARHQGGLITFGADPRITKLGRVLRQTKIDELPQLINILCGEMSFVGPRPEVRPYVELFREDYAEILSILPGITDLASMQYRDEAKVLGRFAEPDSVYIKHILPAKIKLAKEYVRRSSFFFDMTLIVKTLLKLFQ